jgi:hypothetical protein
VTLASNPRNLGTKNPCFPTTLQNVIWKPLDVNYSSNYTHDC